MYVYMDFTRPTCLLRQKAFSFMVSVGSSVRPAPLLSSCLTIYATHQ